MMIRHAHFWLILLFFSSSLLTIPLLGQGNPSSDLKPPLGGFKQGEFIFYNRTGSNVAITLTALEADKVYDEFLDFIPYDNTVITKLQILTGVYFARQKDYRKIWVTIPDNSGRVANGIGDAYLDVVVPGTKPTDADVYAFAKYQVKIVGGGYNTTFTMDYRDADIGFFGNGGYTCPSDGDLTMHIDNAGIWLYNNTGTGTLSCRKFDKITGGEALTFWGFKSKGSGPNQSLFNDPDFFYTVDNFVGAQVKVNGVWKNTPYHTHGNRSDGIVDFVAETGQSYLGNWWIFNYWSYPTANYATVLSNGTLRLTPANVPVGSNIDIDAQYKIDKNGFKQNPQNAIALKFELKANYPNPFNPSTNISYQITEATEVRLTVYNPGGQRVRQLVREYQTPGSYQITFDASSLASGTYLYILQAGSQQQIRKMLLLK